MSKFQLFVSGFRAMGGYPKWNKAKGVDINANCFGYENRQSEVPSACTESMHRRDGWRNATTSSSVGQPIDPDGSSSAIDHGLPFGQNFEPPTSSQSYLSDLLGPGFHHGQAMGNDPQGSGMANWGQSSTTGLQSVPGGSHFHTRNTTGLMGHGQETGNTFERMDDVTDAIGGFMLDSNQTSESSGTRGFSYNSSSSYSYGHNVDGSGSGSTSLHYPENFAKVRPEINKNTRYAPSYIDSSFDKNTPPAFTHSLGNPRLYLEQTNFSGSNVSHMEFFPTRTDLSSFGHSYGTENAQDTSLWQVQNDCKLNTLTQPLTAGQNMTGSEDTQSILSQGGTGLTAELVTDSSNCDDVSDIEQIYNILMSPERTYDDRDEEPCTDDDKRVLRRREKNRLAAQKCRQKKRDASNNLVKQYQDLESSNTQLKYEIRQFEKQKVSLEKLLSSHLPECTKHAGTCSAATPMLPATASTSMGASSQSGIVLHSQQDTSTSSSPAMCSTVGGGDQDDLNVLGDHRDSEKFRLMMKRSSDRDSGQGMDEGKKVRLPEPTQSSMVIPTPDPRLSQRLDARSVASGQSSESDSGIHFDLSTYQRMQIHSTTERMTEQVPTTNPSSSNTGWSLDKTFHDTSQGRPGQPSLYQTTCGSQSQPRKTVTESGMKQTFLPQLSDSVGLQNIPSQITANIRRPTSAHMTQDLADMNISANQRQSEVTRQMHLAPPVAPPLVISPPRCIGLVNLPTHTRPLSVPAHGKPQLTTATLTSVSASESSSSSSLPVVQNNIDAISPHMQAYIRSSDGDGRKRGKAIDFSTGFNIPD